MSLISSPTLLMLLMYRAVALLTVGQ